MHCSCAGGPNVTRGLSLDVCQAQLIPSDSNASHASEVAQAQVKEALELIEAALTKVTDVPCQELLESCAQLQALLGLPPAQLPSISPEQKAVSEVWPAECHVRL